jgi:mRNA interferase MazF
MARLLKGDIVLANLDPTQGNEQSGKRPVLLVSNDIFNEKSGTVIAVALTSQPQKAGFPLVYQLPDRTLPKKAWVKISQIRTLSVERLEKTIGRVSHEDLENILEGLNEILN